MAKETTAKIDYLKILETSHFKKKYVPKPENIILKIDNSIIGTLGNFVVYSGLPKAGKSTFINAFIASAFGNKNNDYFKHRLLTNKSIGLFDTESSEDDFYNNLNRIKFIARETELPVNLNAFMLREYDSATIKILIELYLSKWHPSVIIVDGLLDIINNFNDEKESKEVIQWLKLITKKYNCLLIGVIHLGKKDNHTLGHFGSMLDRYAQSVLEVQRDYENNIYTLKPKYLRSAKDWFSPFSIRWTGNNYEETFPPIEDKKKR